jgi:hypothetical protein
MALERDAPQRTASTVYLIILTLSIGGYEALFSYLS